MGITTLMLGDASGKINLTFRNLLYPQAALPLIFPT